MVKIIHAGISALRNNLLHDNLLHDNLPDSPAMCLSGTPSCALDIRAGSVDYASEGIRP